jgi:hypothetical protein
VVCDRGFKGFKNRPSWLHVIKTVIQIPFPVVENNVCTLNAALNTMDNIVSSFDEILVGRGNYQEPKSVGVLFDKANHALC